MKSFYIPFIRKGFTLIELLIVVAIIAILAAIAVPNFLEAQVRAKVSRAKADMRTLATGLETYFVDNNSYPDVERTTLTPPIKLGTPYSRAALAKVTTPVSYLTNSRLFDPFADKNPDIHLIDPKKTAFFGYANLQAATLTDYTAVGVSFSAGQQGRLEEHRFILQSVGPDTQNFALQGTPNQNFDRAVDDLTQETGYLGNFFYDPTNGTSSTGDIVRSAEGQLN